MGVILGCNILGHDTTFAFLKDGRLEYVLEEERFNRRKHSFSYSTEGLSYGLQKLNIKLSDIEYVANFMDSSILDIENPPFDFGEYNDHLIDNINLFKSALSQYELKLLSLFPEDKIVNVRHHMAHCAGVFYPSEFKESAILCIDGRGEAETVTIAYGENEDIEIKSNILYPHSLGHFYDAITHWLGWGFGEEGKTMALSSYGKPIYYNKLLDELISVDGGNFRMKRPFWCEKRFATIQDMFGQRRERGDEISQYHKDVAASAQKLLEDIVINLVKSAKKLVESDNLIITGGVALNSVANGKVLKSKIFKNVRVYPHSNDIGATIGAAYYVYYKNEKRQRVDYWIFDHPYLGADIDCKNIEKVAKEYGLSYRKSENVTKDVAALLADNLVVGWIQGRSEIGPRALGNRSILANPLDVDAKDKVNNKVKFREEWRPFAPSVLEEDCSLYFELDPPLPYMTIVSKVKPQWQEKLYSITHIDGTARVQTVNRNQNEKYYDLINEFKKLTGVGILLDTSFNVNSEPIVQTSREAIEDFLRTDMDVLVIGDYIFEEKPENISIGKFELLQNSIFKNIHRGDSVSLVYFEEFKKWQYLDRVKDRLSKIDITYNIYDNDTMIEDAEVLLVVLNESFQNYSGFGNRDILKDQIEKLKRVKYKKFLLLDCNGLILTLKDIEFLLDGSW